MVISPFVGNDETDDNPYAGANNEVVYTFEKGWHDAKPISQTLKGLFSYSESGVFLYDFNNIAVQGVEATLGIMGAPYSYDLRVRVVDAIDGGMSKMTAHRTFRVSRSTIDHWLGRRESEGHFEATRSYVRGPAPTISDPVAFEAFAWLHGGQTLKQMAALWQEQTGQSVSGQTLSVTFKRANWTRKKSVGSTPEALSEKHAPTRAQFGEEVSHIAPSKRVYVDQCGLDNTLVCAYGWSPKGKRCPGIRLGHKTARVSVMAALCQGQLIAPLTFTGSCDAALVEAWMEQHLLPLLSEGQVVILDNASFHRKAPLRALLATQKLHLVAPAALLARPQ